VIAAGMENGELALWDPKKILAGETYVIETFFSSLVF
jgi:hypothetical protein